jgi:phosphoribosyl 1,2-cyclic phosphodiesterase
MLTKRYDIPIITAPDTLTAMEQSFISGRWFTDSGPLIEPSLELAAAQETQISEVKQRILLPVGSTRVIGDIEVTSFPISHDAVSPCGYLLHAGGCRVCVVTDSGEVTPTMLAMMQHADLLILESNHDRERLLRGPYPYHLKQRILSATGHLSNDQAAEAVLQTWRTDSVRWLWLSHLSRTNNTPKLALQSMLTHLSEVHANQSQVHISVLPPGLGGVWDSTQLWQSRSLWEMEG